MRFVTITIFAVTGSLVAPTIAKPVPHGKAGGGMAIPLSRHPSFLDTNGSIDLDAISSHGILVREKILRGLANYERNTGMMHPFAVERSESGLGRRDASVPLTAYQNNWWNAEISIGTPPQTLNVHVDTGAADMWVLETASGVIGTDRDLWDPNLSESVKDEMTSFRLSYSDGSIVEGYLYSDNVTIAEFTADPQTFGSVTSYSSNNNQWHADGLLGLAFPFIAKFPHSPLFESLDKQNRLINTRFSLKLSSTGAEMYVGGANSMLYNGEIAYTPVTHPGFWQVSMDDVRVNGNIILENIPAIFDTGSNYIFGDWERVSELYRSLGGSLEEYKGFGYYSLPCDSFPTLSLTFGGKTFTISTEALRLQPIKGVPNCFSAIIAQRSRTAYWNVGTTFLQGVYSLFEYDTSRVGFANLA